MMLHNKDLDVVKKINDHSGLVPLSVDVLIDSHREALAEIERLRDLLRHAVEQWANAEMELHPQDWHEHGAGQLMQECVMASRKE
jgi:hypothetical protein